MSNVCGDFRQTLHFFHDVFLCNNSSLAYLILSVQSPKFGKIYIFMTYNALVLHFSFIPSNLRKTKGRQRLGKSFKMTKAVGIFV